MRFLPLLLLLLLIASCGSAPVRPTFADFVEIREIQSDDPLASRFLSESGDEYRLGDPVLSGKQISRFQVKPGKGETYDLHLTLTGAMEARWRRFARSRGREAALVVDGKVCCVFTVADPGEPTEGSVLILTVPDVATTSEQAAEMERFLEDNKSSVKKKDSRE
ncbi:MAG: hypothetical protein RRA94_08670 [Bacteroidota bacterium]|nr:hypothetical protein [Bacteroidota bacterium]